MSVDAFLDTNVLIYAVSSAASESVKKEKALELIEHVDFGLSAQVLAGVLRQRHAEDRPTPAS